MNNRSDTRGADLILLAGLWLTGRVWDPVVAELTRLGQHPIVPSLPGVDDGVTTAGIDEQVSEVVAAVDAADRPVVVGHSATATLAWLAADRRPLKVAQVVLVGGFPGTDGSTYADLAPIVDGVMPFPGWEPFEGPDSADLDPAARDRFAHDAVPVPAAVAHATVRLGDDRRFAVPVALVCPEFSPDQARAWLAAGEIPELQRTVEVSFADIDSGHWPMISRPVEFARLLDAIVREG